MPVTTITFLGNLVGNNGRGGLLRMHWAAKLALIKNYMWAVRASSPAKHGGRVRLELVRHSLGVAMDFDNLVSTGKVAVDAIVRCGVIVDDNPEVIVERVYRCEKIKKGDTPRTVITITDLP